jgi:hypothetical protein
MNDVQHVSNERLHRIMNDARGKLVSNEIFENYEAAVTVRDVRREQRRRGKVL